MTGPQANTTVRPEGGGRSALRAAVASAGTGRTIVVNDPRTGLQALHRQPMQMEIMLSAPRAVWTVDTTEYHVEWTVELPSATRPYAFLATIVPTWRVTDPVEAVRTGLTEPGALCWAYLDPILREAAAQYSIDRSTELNAHLDRLGLARRLTNGVSLVRCAVRVQLDDAARAHLDRLERRQRDREMWAEDHLDVKERRRRDREMRDEDHVGLMHHQERQFTEAESRHRLAQQNQQLQQQLEMQDRQFQEQMRQLQAESENRIRLMNEANARQIEGERMRFYAEALEGGNLNLIALRLASNREEVQAVVGLLMEQRQLSFNQAHGMVNALLENGMLNRSDARDLNARTAKVIADHLSGPVFGLPGGGPAGPAALPPDGALPPAPAVTAGSAADPSVVTNDAPEAVARAERLRRDRERDAAEEDRDR